MRLAQPPRRKHRQNRHANAQPHVDGQKLNHRLLRQQRVNDRRRDDGDPWRAIARVARRKRRGKIAVVGHRGRHARAGQNSRIQQRKIGDHRCDSHRKSQPGPADQPRGVGKISGMPLLPVAERGERKHRRQKIRRYRQRHDDGQRDRIIPLRVLHFFGHAGHLLVAGIEPQTQRQPHAEDLKRRNMRRHQRRKRIVVPLRCRDPAQRHDRQQDGNFQNRRHRADHLDAAHVDVADQRNHDDGNRVVLPADKPREEKRQIVCRQNGVRAAQKERSAPVPPTGLKSPKVAKRRAHPAVESAFDGNRGGQFRRHQRNRNAPEQGNKQVIEQRQPRSARRHHVFEPKRPARRVRVHHEHEGKQGGLAHGRSRGVGLARYGGNVRWPQLN